VNQGALRWLCAVPLALSLGACGSHSSRADRPFADRDGAPPVPADVSRIPEPVPHAEPRSAYGNQSPYRVLGRTYQVLPSAAGYVERGIASWYGSKFQGRPTSSREPYDMYQISAAHKTLPLPTYVRVTNLESGQSLIVRVNDRGPFHDNRIIDLSYAAAVRLGIQAKGTGLVEVRAIDPADPEQDSTLPRPAIGRHRVYVQVGAFDDRDNARRLQAQLEQAGIEQSFLDRVQVGLRVLHRLRIGPLADPAATDALTERLSRLGLTSMTIAVD